VEHGGRRGVRVTAAEALLESVTDAAHLAADARTEFEDAIRAAHPTCSFQQIATAAGLSKSRVHQIVQEGTTT
jgi:hypothetical protein